MRNDAVFPTRLGGRNEINIRFKNTDIARSGVRGYSVSLGGTSAYALLVHIKSSEAGSLSLFSTLTLT